MIRPLSTQIAPRAMIAMQKTRSFIKAFAALSIAFLSAAATYVCAEADPDVEGAPWDIKFQATTVHQRKPSFAAAYSGANSLSTERERSWSATATIFAGARLWSGGEVYLNPEMAMGLPFSALTGLGGFTNGELAKTSGTHPTFYRARAFLRQTWNIGAASDSVEADQNQLAGKASPQRWVLTAGNFSAVDVFDKNAYNHEPRRQFLNWAISTHGAWDYPADARGYTVGTALEYYRPDWAFRAGRFMQPKESNGLPLNPRIFFSYGDVAEVEHAYTLGSQPGRVRLLAFRNVARMASYQAAIDAASSSPGNGVPNINTVRAERSKVGYGINLEQAIGKDIGLFLRASRADGKTETFAYSEIDSSISGGIILKGAPWARPNDDLGIAIARNQLSSSHSDYLRAGGLGFFLGDGALGYGPEQITEVYYSAALTRNFWVSLNGQRIRNPGYNTMRGPVSFFGLRMHIEF